MTHDDAMKFVQVWYESKTMDEVVARFGKDRRYCSNLAGSIRRRGIPLPARPSAKASIVGVNKPSLVDWAALKRYALVCQGAAEAARYRNG